MAKGKKTGGRDFKPGQSGNPLGPPVLPPEVKEARKLTRIEFERIASQYMQMTKEEITKKLQDPKSTTLELIVMTIIHKAVKDGDQHRLDFLLNRLIGKVKDEVDVNVYPKPTIIQKRDGTQEILGVEEIEEEK